MWPGATFSILVYDPLHRPSDSGVGELHHLNIDVRPGPNNDVRRLQHECGAPSPPIHDRLEQKTLLPVELVDAIPPRRDELGRVERPPDNAVGQKSPLRLHVARFDAGLAFANPPGRKCATENFARVPALANRLPNDAVVPVTS
jgi:hypothetical protein